MNSERIYRISTNEYLVCNVSGTWDVCKRVGTLTHVTMLSRSQINTILMLQHLHAVTNYYDNLIIQYESE